MSVKMSVYYRQPEDADGFETHYLGEHLPLVDKYENLTHRSLHKVRRSVAGDFPYAYVFTATWDDPEGMKADLNSEAAAEATKDAESLGVPFDVVIFEQLV